MIHSLVFNVKHKSFIAFQDLKNAGLENPEAAQIFKNKINQLIDLLKSNDDPHKKSKKIENEINEQNKLLNLVDLLIKFNSHPTETSAQRLRELAESDTNNAEFIKEQMNKQNKRKFRFNYPNARPTNKVIWVSNFRSIQISD